MQSTTSPPRTSTWQIVLLGSLFAVAFAGGAVAEATPANDESSETTLQELEEKLRVLAEEIADLKSDEAVPDDLTETDGFSGLGPAASKVYRRDRGLSIGGYGDVRFQHQTKNSNGRQDVFDALRFVLYTGYKFNDWLVMNSEVEFEHGSTSKSGSASIEFLTVDFLVEEYFNIRAGLVLIPMGFLNEVHEPPFYFGAERPEVERRILPTTWRENGGGIFGTFDLGGGGDVHYRMYGVNGFDAKGFRDNGLRGGRQNGSEALADDWAFVGRVDYEAGDALPGFLIGGSVYAGKSGQNQTNSVCIANCTTPPGDVVIQPTTETRQIPDAFVHIYEFHAQYKAHGLSLRGLFAHAFVDDAGSLSRALDLGTTSSVAQQMIGGYAEIAYDVMPLFFETNMSLEPFFRYEYLDTQYDVAGGFRKDLSLDYDLYVYGVSYKPIPQVVVKLDYRDFQAKRGSLSDQVQASIGFVF